jgi:hypothetical protein
MQRTVRRLSRFSHIDTGAKPTVQHPLPTGSVLKAASQHLPGSAPTSSASTVVQAVPRPSPAAPTTPQPPTAPVALQAPYPTEGGAVPIYSMANGRVSKRLWTFRNSSWCELCKEPVALWVNHHGRKDHALMDLHYTQMVEFPRAWDPVRILTSFLDLLGVQLERYHRHYARYDLERRVEIRAMMAHLEEVGMLHLGDPRGSFLARVQGGLRGMDNQGALVLHRYIVGPFMRLYPDGGIQDFSNMVDFVTCAYNMETVYDVCGFCEMDRLKGKGMDLKPSSPAALGLGGIASSSSATTGYQSAAATATVIAGSGGGGGVGTAAEQQQQHEEAFSRKAVFVRQVLGQLRWAQSEERVHPTGRVFPPHAVVLAEVLLKALVAEIIAVRLCEYMVRVEPVWRDLGLERTALAVAAKATAGRSQAPALVKFGYRAMAASMDDVYDVSAPVPVDPSRRGTKK